MRSCEHQEEIVRMRILLCDNLVPSGAAHEPALRALETCYASEHETERILIPYVDNYFYSANQLLAMRLISVADRADAIICLSPPSYLIPHPNKIILQCGEPSMLSIKSGAPEWMTNALLRGWREAKHSYVLDRRRYEQLLRLGVKVEHIPLPKQSKNHSNPEWARIAQAILQHAGREKTR